MNQIVKYKIKDCYLIITDNTVLTSTSYWQSMHQNWIKTVMWELLMTVTVFHISMKESLERKLSNSITVYRNLNVFMQIKIIINEWSHLFENHDNIIDIFETEYMNILLLNNWQNKYKSDQTQVYSLSANNQAQIDKAFNKLHNQNHMKWTNIFTSFSFLCFIVWCTLSDNIQKDCIVVDIRVLNKISMSDTYSVFLQEDILITVQNIKYILTVNCSAYFYQWQINSEHQHHLTVIFYCSQKTFKVAVMSYCNISMYIQQMMN